MSCSSMCTYGSKVISVLVKEGMLVSEGVDVLSVDPGGGGGLVNGQL
jgi:hypothetical protein